MDTEEHPWAFHQVGLASMGLVLLDMGGQGYLYFMKQHGERPLWPEIELDEKPVAFDDDGVRVEALNEDDSDWNQSFRWPDVSRVCFDKIKSLTQIRGRPNHLVP